MSLDSDVPGRADAVVTSSVRSLRLIRTRGPEKAGSATTVRPATPKRKNSLAVGPSSYSLPPQASGLVTMKRMVALASPTLNESNVEPSPYAWLRTRAPVPTTYAPACDPLYPFQEILENRTSRARGMTGSCTEVVERKFSSCIEIWQVELESCVWRVSFHKYAYVHGDPVQGVDPTGEFIQPLITVGLYAMATLNAVSGGYNAIQSVRAFQDASMYFHAEHFFGWMTSLIKTSFYGGLAAIDLASAVSLATMGGGGPGSVSLPGFSLAVGTNGTLAISKSLVTSITVNWSLINTFASAMTFTQMGIISMAASGSGPFWQGQENFESDVLGKGNWTYEAPSNPAKHDNRLPEYDFVRDRKTRGIFEVLGAKAYIQSGKEGPGLKAFGSIYGTLSAFAREAISHAEGHALGVMRRINGGRGVKEGTITINFPGGPCEACRKGVPELMRDGEILWVKYVKNGVEKLGNFTKSGGWKEGL